MSGVVIHFGVDSSYRLPLLQNAGFEVVDCGTSLSKFNRAIADHQVCAVAVSQSGLRGLSKLSQLRSRKSVPVILFAAVGAPEKLPDIDLVIPALTPPPDWLTQISELLKKSRKIAEESRSIRRESIALREQSAGLRAESALERKRSAIECSKNGMETSRGKKEEGDLL